MEENSKMRDEIGIVTAFFDIGRGELEEGIKRSNNIYLEYFRFWARIQNRMVIYTEQQFVNEILEIRESFNQKENTEIIIIDDVTKIESQLYKKMSEVEKKGMGIKYKYFDKALSSTALYDYIMLLKYWFIHDAISQDFFKEVNKVAWIDFGFNHGGECYTDATQFAFKWQYPFSKKVQIFALRKDIQKIGAGYSLLLQCDIVQGIVVLPVELSEELWKAVKEAMEALLMLDTIDDDQQLLFMAYRKQPELFEVHYTDWFMQFKDFGAGFLSINSGVEKKKMSCKGLLKEIYTVFKQTGKKFFQDSKNIEYSKRLLDIARKEYPNNG